MTVVGIVAMPIAAPEQVSVIANPMQPHNLQAGDQEGRAGGKSLTRGSFLQLSLGFGLKVHSTWHHLVSECKSSERSKGNQAGSLHKSIRKLNTVKSARCLPAVPTMKTEIILVKHDL